MVLSFSNPLRVAAWFAQTNAYLEPGVISWPIPGQLGTPVVGPKAPLAAASGIV